MRKGKIMKWGLIAAFWSVAFLSLAQQPEHGWSGDDPSVRSGGCAFFTLTPNPTAPTCNDFEDGIASVIPSDGVGPYTYNWIGGPNTQSWNNVGAGTYTVIVFDQGQGGLPCNIDVFVNEPGPLTVFSMNAVPPTCFGACNGEAMPIVIGGNNGYSYEWDSGETGIMADELCNPFQLTITDAKGCVLDTLYYFDDAPEDIIITADSTNVSCFDDADGAIDISVSGGSPGFTYSWTGPGGFTSASEDISGLEEGIYTVIVTDANDCEAEATFEITAPEELEVEADITDNPCAEDLLGAIEITPAGGTPGYSYSWTGPDGFVSDQQNISNLAAGEYELLLTDANGCTFTESLAVAEPPAIEIELTVTPVSCNGGNDGAIDAMVTGGAGGFTFSWTGPDGFTAVTEDISGLAVGNYILTVTDASGCENTAEAEITEPEPLEIDGSVTDISCNGNADGAIELQISGGTPDYTISWTGPSGFVSTDQDISDLFAGSYAVEVTDENGCVQVALFEVVEPDLMVIDAEITDNLCAGQSIGAIELSITGGTAPFTFEWTGPGGFVSDQQNISGLAEGSYTVQVTDDNGCQQAGIFEVGETNPIELELTPTMLTCPDDNNGAVALEISGGTPNYTVLWTGPDGFTSNDQNITGLSQGVYMAEVTDANGCTATDATEVLALDTMVVSAVVEPISCTGLSDGAISITVAGGTPDYTFSWTGPGGFTAITADITGLSAGTYNLTVTDANDCFTEISVELEDPAPLELSADITDVTCNGIYDGVIDLNVTGGTSPYTFQWSGPAGFSSSQEDINNLNIGNYTVLVTDSLGCTANASFTVEAGEGVMAEAIVTDASCDTNDDGMIVATVTGGTPGYAIFWLGPDGFTGNTLTITGLAAGTYTLYATDSQDCFVEASFTVNNPSSIEIDADITHNFCAGEANGAIDVTLTNATGPITTVWSGPDGFSSTDEDIFNLEAGSYTLTVIDSLNCITEELFAVNAPPALDLSLLAVDPTCGFSNGQIIATVSGGTVSDDYTYLWTDESANIIGSGNQVNNLGSGSYTITISDDNGCTIAETVELSESDLEIEAAITDLLCNGDGNGAIEITVTGGFPPYDFNWSGPEGFTSADQNIFNLTGGDYTLVITDSISCSIEETFSVIEPDSIEILISAEHISCNGLTDGSILAGITGGTAPYSIVWQGPDGFTSADTMLTDLAAGTYDLQVTDANDCIAGVSVTIDEPALIEVEASITDITCSGQPEGAIALTVSGGTAPLTIEWSGPDGFTSDQSSISGLLAGDYTLVITDDNGCVFAEVYTIAEENPIDVETEISGISCTGLSDGAISINVTGGTPDYSFSWTGPDGFTANTSDITGLTAGTYNLTVTDANDCFTEISVEIEDPAPLELSADITDVTCNGIFDGEIDLSVVGGTAPYTFQWSGPAGFSSSQEDITNLNIGNYTVLVTDSLGCTANASFTVEAGEGVMAEAVVTDASCDTNDDGMIVATVTGGTPGYAIFWLGPDGFTGNTLTITGLAAGTYTLYATDTQDCFVEASFTVNNPSSIEIDADITHNICAGEANGAIDVTLTNATGPITTVWSGPGGFSSTDEDIFNLEAGNYTLTVIDSLNCLTEEVFAVNAPPALDLSLLAVDPTCGLSNGQIIATVSGGTVSDDYTYLWTDESANIIGSSNQVNNLGPGSYTITVADDNGCTIAETVELTESDLEIEAAITDLLCNGDANGSIEITVTGGFPPYDFNWSGPEGFTSADQNIFNLSGGDYTLTVTDSIDCSIEETFSVIEPDSMSITSSATDPLCAGDANGTILTEITGGTPGYEFNWSGSGGYSSTSQNISDLIGGTYVLMVTDTNGCVATAEATITAPQPIGVIADMVNVLCFGDTTGSIDLTVFGGTEAYVINWTGPDGFSSSSEDLSNLVAGTYNFNLVDANFCAFDTAFVIAQPEVLEVVETISDITCFGENDGSISIEITGGVPVYDIVWSGPGGFTSNEASIDSISAGDYHLIVTDSVGCTLETTFSITEPSELLLDVDVDQPECLQANGELTAVVSGGTAPYSYLWENENGDFISDEPVLSDLTAGLYFISVTDSNGCEVSDWIALSDLGGEVLATITDVTCFGGDDGTISTTVLNAVEPLDYAWSNPSGFTADTPDIANLPADVYNVVVTDSLGCVYAASFEVNQPDSISINATVDGISCFGGDGAISLLVSGGIPPYDFSWTGPGGFAADTSAIAELTEGNYVVVVTDSVGCAATATFEMTELAPLSLAFLTTDVSCNGFNDGAIDLTVTGGESPYSYIWIGPNGFTSDAASIDSLAPGFYEVQVTDNNGCVETDGVLINEPTAIELVTNSLNSSCGNNNGSATVMASGGTTSGNSYTFTWLDSEGFVIDTTNSVENLAPGAYTIIVEDDNGCTATETIVISDSDGIITAEITPPSCSGGDDGAIDITVAGGTEPYTFSWTGPDGFASTDQNISGLFPGDYVVEVTDSAGCVFVELFVLEIPETVLLDFDVTQILCNGDDDGAIAVNISGGIAPYEVQWSGPEGFVSSDTLIQNLVPGNYTIIVTDSALCVTTENIVITEPAAIDAEISAFHNLCSDDTNGALTIVVSGGTEPYTFQWIGPNGFESQGQNLGGLHSGIYEVLITDTLGCTAQFLTEIQSTSVISVDLDMAPVQCYGDSTGSISAAITGGTAPFILQWTGPDGFSSTDSTIENLLAGNYQLLIVDSNSCSLQIETVIPQPDSLFAAVSATMILCFGENDGAIETNVSGGTAPYTYSWTGPDGFTDTTATLSGLAAGNYQLIYTDSLGCSGMEEVVITEPKVMEVNLQSLIHAICNTDDSGEIAVDVSGGTEPYVFEWSGPDEFTSDEQNITDLFTGVYALTVMDSSGCTASFSAEVEYIFEIDADAGQDTMLCENEQPYLLLGTPLNADSAWWADANGDILSLTDTFEIVVLPGDYTFYYHVSSGLCSDVDSVMITILELPDVEAGPDEVIVEGEEVSLGGNPTSSTATDFVWTPNYGMNDSTVANPLVSPEITTTYEVVVTDENGCFNNDFVVITVLPDIVVTSGISPNGDGYNDEWIIDYIDEFPGNVVEVYNRWGDLLYRTEGYNNEEPWDGYYNGKLLPVGTYYYVIELNDERFPEPFTGPITIFR